MLYSSLPSLLRFPWQNKPAPTPPVVPELMQQIEARIREIQAQAQADVKELRQAIENQAELISSQAADITALRTVEQQLRGELRQAFSEISMLRGQVEVERTAREKQALEAARESGRMTAELTQADSRLKFQRDEITLMQGQLAILNEERTTAIQVSTVWRMRAEGAEKQLREAGIIPTALVAAGGD